jgi:anti-sigma factor RsiW
MSVRCFLLRSELVDFASGALGDPRGAIVERHVASCPHCAESVLALREVPAALARRGRPQPGEDFWVRQRAQIMQVIEAGPPLPARRPTMAPIPSPAWRLVPALAAAAVALFLVVNWLPSMGERPQGSTARTATEVAPSATDDSLTALVDEPWPTVPEDVASADDTTLAESMAEELGGINEASLI